MTTQIKSFPKILTFSEIKYYFKFIEISWPGIVLQLAVVPIIVFLIQKYISDKNGGKI